MSTILDALRKIEEERRSRTADVRSRLLLSSPFKATLSSQMSQAQRKTRLTLPFILGFTLVSFAAGASFMLWRSQSDAVAPEQSTAQLASTVPRPSSATFSKKLSSTDKTSRTAVVSSPATPEPTLQRQKIPEPSAPALVQEDLPPTPVIPLPASPPEATKQRAPTDGSAVQRSPFTAPPPPPKEPTPRPRVMGGAVPVAPPPAESTAMREWRRRHQQPTQAHSSPPAQGLAPPDTKEIATENLSAPAGTTLSMLQWSSDPERRIAFLRVNGGPLTMAHEGDTIGGYKVVSIRQNGVELQSGESRVMLHAR
ncbi:MAG: hypothetical protein HYZ50_14140 [Deltaproteobacteria bacterium]|nr:hypothetical protein [Deltaproteobacteria bacterium]